MSDREKLEQARETVEFVSTMIDGMRKQMSCLCTKDEMKAFDTQLVQWAEGVSARHSASGCYADAPNDIMPLDSPARQTPCMVCGIIIGSMQARGGVTGEFFESLVSQTATGLGVKSHSPS